MADICFVNPPKPDLVEPHAQAPLGVLYLAGAVEAAGATAGVANLTGAEIGQPGSWRLPEADCYGVTGTFLDVAAVNAVARELDRRFPTCRILVGGPIALSEEELDRGLIDCVVHGEAEDEVVDLLQSGAGSVHCTAPSHLDALAEPARHLWPGPLGGDIFFAHYRYFGGGSTTMLTSRGCPMNCAFCAGPKLVSRTVRTRSADSVIAEMERCVVDFGIRQFRLSDEFFTATREHMTGICEAIMRSERLKNGDGVAWRCSIGMNPHDVEMYRTLRAAGCREVAIGVESADPAILDLVSRKGTPADALVALENARAAGIRTRALLMVGLPGTTEATLIHNLKFLRTAPFDAVAITIFTPVPGCDIALDPEKYGCRLVPGDAESLSVETAAGAARISPRVNPLTMGMGPLAEQMSATIAAADRIGKLGRG